MVKDECGKLNIKREKKTQIIRHLSHPCVTYIQINIGCVTVEIVVFATMQNIDNQCVTCCYDG